MLKVRERVRRVCSLVEAWKQLRPGCLRGRRARSKKFRPKARRSSTACCATFPTLRMLVGVFSPKIIDANCVFSGIGLPGYVFMMEDTREFESGRVSS